MDVHHRLRDFWDRDAEVYDRSPSHAVSDPVEAAAWRATLLRHLPPPGARVLDVGAGTGALSLLAAELGYSVTALDLSPQMLERAAGKARALGLELSIVVAPATEPPAGPFDAVMERHVLWTAPYPLAALRAWREVAPAGRLVLYEALAGGGVGRRTRDAAAGMLRRLLRVPADHHAHYDHDLLASLPLAEARTPSQLIGPVLEAGWRRPRVERLRDVEWARRLSSRGLVDLLEQVPRFALLAGT